MYSWTAIDKVGLEQPAPGTDVVILKIFSQKNRRKSAFLSQNKAKLCKK
jgi:hypothetical protein